MKCRKCGKELQADATFCAFCGERYPFDSDRAEEQIEFSALLAAKDEGIEKEREIFETFLRQNVKQYQNYPKDEEEEQETKEEQETQEEQEESHPIKETSAEKLSWKDKSTEEKLIFVLIRVVIFTFIVFVGVVAYLFLSRNAERHAQEENAVMEQNIPEEWKEEKPKKEIDVEEDITALEEIYLDIVDGLSQGKYRQIVIGNGVTAYDEAGALKAVIEELGTGGIAYKRTYYYDNNTLFCAEYENQEAHKFYFCDNVMIRWVHYKDAKNKAKMEVHDMEKTPEYARLESDIIFDATTARDNWEETLNTQSKPPEQVEEKEETQAPEQTNTQVNEEMNKPPTEQKPPADQKPLADQKPPTEQKPSIDRQQPTDQRQPVSQKIKEGYMLPNSDNRYIDASELEGMTKEELKIARNEIYARHGRKFADQDLQEHFNQQEWYYPEIGASEFQNSVLNDYERANCDTIMQYEKNS